MEYPNQREKLRYEREKDQNSDDDHEIMKQGTIDGSY
jgi:hypothetical protein